MRLSVSEYNEYDKETRELCCQCVVLLKSVNVRREGDHMVARFTDEEWEKVQAVLDTLKTEG